MISFIIVSSVPDQVEFIYIYNYLPILFILYFINTQKTLPEVLILLLEKWSIYSFLNDLCPFSCRLDWVGVSHWLKSPDMVSQREVLKDLLNTRYNIPYLPCGKVIQLPFGGWSLSITPHNTFIDCCLKDIRGPNWSDLVFKFN